MNRELRLLMVPFGGVLLCAVAFFWLTGKKVDQKGAPRVPALPETPTKPVQRGTGTQQATLPPTQAKAKGDLSRWQIKTADGAELFRIPTDPAQLNELFEELCRCPDWFKVGTATGQAVFDLYGYEWNEGQPNYEVASFVERLAREHPDPRVRGEVTAYLSNLGPAYESTFKNIVAALSKDREASVRRSVIDYLSRRLPKNLQEQREESDVLAQRARTMVTTVEARIEFAKQILATMSRSDTDDALREEAAAGLRALEGSK